MTNIAQKNECLTANIWSVVRKNIHASVPENCLQTKLQIRGFLAQLECSGVSNLLLPELQRYKVKFSNTVEHW